MEFPTLISWTSLFLFLGLLGGIFIFIQILKEHYVSKQWRPCSDAASAASDLGLHCFSIDVSQKGR